MDENDAMPVEDAPAEPINDVTEGTEMPTVPAVEGEVAPVEGDENTEADEEAPVTSAI